jgi:lipopolysaccharide/colanic/teichoic acid biosynthesis glycosyltransferase
MKEIPEFYYRSNVKPGLTGLAQVKGKYDTKDKEKIRYDLLYVKKSSFWFDLKILILTVKVLFSQGSVTEEENHARYTRYS